MLLLCNSIAHDIVITLHAAIIIVREHIDSHTQQFIL